MTTATGIVLVIAGLAALAGALVAPGYAVVYVLLGVAAVIGGVELVRIARFEARERRRAARRGGYLHR